MPQPEHDPQPSLSAIPAFLRRRGSGHAATTGSSPTIVAAPMDPAPASASPRSTAGAASPRRGAGAAAGRLDPSTLPPFSRRRLALLAAGLVAAWLLIAFGREVADAATASDRAAQLRQANAQLQADLTALQTDLARADDETFVNVAARGHGLGVRHEVPFALAAGAPSLAPDAPGSAATRVGAPDTAGSPLEAWLELLFGGGS